MHSIFLSSFAILGVALVSIGCSKRDGGAERNFDEKAFVEKELVELKRALAEGSVSGVLVGCSSVTVSMERIPESIEEEIAHLCYVAAPRLSLQDAVAEAKRGAAESPGMPEITCMNLFVKDAFLTLQEHPTDDPEVRKLVAEYTRLCPDRVAKFKGADQPRTSGAGDDSK